MIELAQHIEALLLENDCVIIPGLGGFVAHYVPTTHIKEENIFLPPTRVIGFNPQLKMNDGLIVQSYMTVYGTNFSDATKMVEHQVKEISAILQENGKIELPNIGELHYTIDNKYNFIPYDDKITTPFLYGLDMFVMKELSAIKEEKNPKNIPFPAPTTNKQTTIKLYSGYLAKTAAIAAIIILSIFFSTPIQNTEVMKENYAKLLPEELFEKIEKQSLVFNPVIIKETPTINNSTSAIKKNTTKEKAITPKVAVKSAAVTKVKVNAVKVIPSISKPYHIIIASLGTEKDAQHMAAQLNENGFSSAKAIIGGDKMRVSINSYETESKAYQVLSDMRQNEKYKNAWILKQ
ncbi:MAG: SPOR domain-containing protein [Bacteroides sp.]|jgi:hypothetical protein|nr:SPOR domain-containing protein [Bacteroides sp.]